MVTVTNTTQRTFNLPKRGEVGPIDLHPGATIPLPDAYARELFSEKGWRKRIEPDGRGGWRVKGPRLGSIDPEARERERLAELERRAKAGADKEAQRAILSLEKRLASLEGDRAELGDARRRIAELEAELAKTRAASPSEAKPASADAKSDGEPPKTTGRRS